MNAKNGIRPVHPGDVLRDELMGVIGRFVPRITLRARIVLRAPWRRSCKPLREALESDARAHSALRSAVFEARRVSKQRMPPSARTRAQRSGVETKTNTSDTRAAKGNGAKGAASTTPSLRSQPGAGPAGSDVGMTAGRHKQPSHGLSV